MNIEIKKNQKLNGIELYMSAIPDSAQKETLKEMGYKFHRNKSCWYIREELYNSDILDKLNATESTGNTIHDILSRATKAAYQASLERLEYLESQPPQWEVTDGEGQTVGTLQDVCGGAWVKFVANTTKNRGLANYIKAHAESGYNSHVFKTEDGEVRMGKGYPNGFNLYFKTVPTQYKSVEVVAANAFSSILNQEGFEVYVHSYID